MKNLKAVFIKQLQSMIKSPALLVQGILFAAMVLVMTFLIGPDRECDVCIPATICDTCLEEDPRHSWPEITFAGVFTVMFVGMALMGSASALVQEDKTTHNLRFMTMAGVKPFQYLPGTAAALFIVTFGLLLIFGAVGRYFGAQLPWFIAATTAGAAVSILLGIAIGLSKAPLLATPVSMIFGMGPMISTFNENLARWLRFTYTQQVNLALRDLDADLRQNLMIIGANGLVILLAFVWMHRKGELRW
jgi:hypothetical protein